MAQTTTAYSARNARVAFSTDGSSWTDISGSSQSVSAGDGTRLTGTGFTFDGNGAMITAGKLDAQESTLEVFYTETSGEAYVLMLAAFNTANSTAYLRVDPLGSTTGNFRHTTAQGVMTQFPQFPDLDASSGDPMMLEATIQHGGWTKSVIP